MCEWFLSPYPWPGRLSDCAGCWTGGGAGGVTAGWTTGAIGTAAAGALGGGGGVGGAGVTTGGVGVTTGGVALGGCGAGTGFAGAFGAGAADLWAGATLAIGVFAIRILAFGALFAIGFRTTFGARRLARCPAAWTTTI